jgi:hypothetical protein
VCLEVHKSPWWLWIICFSTNWLCLNLQWWEYIIVYWGKSTAFENHHTYPPRTLLTWALEQLRLPIKARKRVCTRKEPAQKKIWCPGNMTTDLCLLGYQSHSS